MIHESEGYGWKHRDLIYFPGVSLDGVRKSTKNLSPDGSSPGRDLNQGPLEYKTGMQAT
jgi:hypothetical protein